MILRAVSWLGPWPASGGLGPRAGVAQASKQSSCPAVLASHPTRPTVVFSTGRGHVRCSTWSLTPTRRQSPPSRCPLTPHARQRLCHETAPRVRRAATLVTGCGRASLIASVRLSNGLAPPLLCQWRATLLVPHRRSGGLAFLAPFVYPIRISMASSVRLPLRLHLVSISVRPLRAGNAPKSRPCFS
jgi:hypothetical protein